MAGERRIVTVRGGLGNQLFQYAFAWALKRRTDGEVVLNTRHYRLPNARSLELVSLRLKLPLSDERRPTRLDSRPARWLLRRFPEGAGNLLNVYSDPGVGRYREEYLGEPRRYYHGYWQSPRYFDQYREELRPQFEFKQPVDVRTKLRRVRPDWAEFLAVHVRRGDYLSPAGQALHGVPPLAYFHDSLERLRTGLNQKNTVFVTDDPEWLRSESGLLDADSVLAADFLDGALEEFALLREARGLVMSNSTFSWWAAYLGDPEVTIVPRYWLRGVPTSSIDIALSGWTVADA